MFLWAIVPVLRWVVVESPRLYFVNLFGLRVNRIESNESNREVRSGKEGYKHT